MSWKINEPIDSFTARILKTYFKFPESQPITALDWNANDGSFLYHLTNSVPLENRFLYGVSNDSVDCDYMRDVGFHRVSNAEYKSEAKITNDVFSMVVINPEIDRRLITEMFEQVDPFTMPNFEESVRADVERQEAEALRLRQQVQSQIDFGELNADNTERVEQQEVVQETEEERAERIEKRVRQELEKRIKAYRTAMKQQQKAIANLRWDTFLLQRATTYLRTGGILVFITPKELIDDSITFKLVNQYEDIKILRLEDQDYLERRKCIIIAKKRRKATREQYELGKELARTKEKPYLSFGHIREITETDPVKRERQEFLAQVDAMYGVIELQREWSYQVPISDPEDIVSFRVGPITASEALLAMQKSKLLPNYIEKNSQVFVNKDPVTPTPLHKGHIMLLLTSGLLNGFIGKGVNQHLVKGSAIKDVREFSDVDDDGETRIVEREYYNIGVKILNSYGEFRKIM